MPTAKTRILISTTDSADDSPIMKIIINRIKTGVIGLMSFSDLLFSCKTRSPLANNDSMADAKNSGDVMTSLNKKSFPLNSSQNQSKLNVRSNTIVPSKPNTLKPLFLDLCFVKKSKSPVK